MAGQKLVSIINTTQRMNIKLKTYERKELKNKLTINDELPIKNSYKKKHEK
jgi:hypothetical protein